MSKELKFYTNGTGATEATVPARALEHRFHFLARSTSTADTSDQAWFWTPEWQAGEREVDEHLAAGRTERFDSVDDFLAALERETG
jgi:hypothetical protein